MFSTVIANKYTELYRNLPCCFLESLITTLVNNIGCADFPIWESKFRLFLALKSGFLRFGAVWGADLLFRINSECILIRFGTQNALESVLKFSKNRKTKRLTVCHR